MWPGRARSSGCVAGSRMRVHGRDPVGGRDAGGRAVARVDRDGERGALASVLSATISGMRSSSSRCPSTGMQITPLVWRIMKAIVSGVIFSAAMMRSPSFSRSASSTTITISPRSMAAIACSILVNGIRGSSAFSWYVSVD